MRRFLLPLFAFLCLASFLAVGLTHKKEELPSPLVGKPAPDFLLQRLAPAGQTFQPKGLAGQVWVLNAWASWCTPCREEMPALKAFSQQNGVPVIGLNYKDKPEAAQRLLSSVGDPYQFTVLDHDGRVGVDYGIYGLPETFVIDKQGVIRLKHVGPLTAEILKSKLLPLIQTLRRG
jgi:cytochrome c biogenesis protein CcmG/thiol:disulfide interchange protein DsbE